MFINLITNAVDAMPDGGILTISSKESDGFVEFAISDTGTGLDKRILENLWKPLQTTKTKGMGLADRQTHHRCPQRRDNGGKQAG